MASTLTVANSSIVMTAEALYPNGVIIRGYAADNLFETAAVENAEVVMGIDGRMASGWVPNPVPFTMTLQADSESLEVFEQIYEFEQSNRNKLEIGVTVGLPSAGKRFSFVNGVIRTYKPPSAQRILQPAVIEFTFERQLFSRT